MTPMIKAPDPGVVKSLAKALRKNLPETVKLPHSKALEIAANSFGFSNWHACRTHFDRLNAGAFDPPTQDPLSEYMEDYPIAARALLILRGESRSFQYKGVTVKGGVSAGRSPLGFLLPLIELGARTDPEVGRDLGRITDPAFWVFLSAKVNRERPMRRWDRSYEASCLEGKVLIGSEKLLRIICVRPGLLPVLLERGLSVVRSEPDTGVIDLLSLKDKLRGRRDYPNPDITFAVDYEPLVNLTRLCQAQINLDDDQKTQPAGEGNPLISSGSAGDASSRAPCPG